MEMRDIMTKEMWVDSFSESLRCHMRLAGMGQHELAELSGIPQSSISRYIQGTRMPSAMAILNMAYALDCRVSDLIDFGDYIVGVNI